MLTSEYKTRPALFRMIFASLFFIVTVQAQIQVTLPDMLKLFNAGDHHYGTNFDGQINIGEPGANKIYDFSYIPLSNEFSLNLNTNDIPALAARYPGCNLWGNTSNNRKKSRVSLFTRFILYCWAGIPRTGVAVYT